MSYEDYKTDETIRNICSSSYYQKLKLIRVLCENKEETEKVILRLSEILGRADYE